MWVGCLGSDSDSLFSLEKVYLTSMPHLYSAEDKSNGVEDKTKSNRCLRTGHSAM